MGLRSTRCFSKNNIKHLWWKKFVDDRQDMYGIDAAILMHPGVWKASGHVDTFTDPLVECKSCNSRFRADQIKELNYFRNVLTDGFTEQGIKLNHKLNVLSVMLSGF